MAAATVEATPVDDTDTLCSEPWRTFLGKIPLRPRSVWTYWELGADFGGAADPRRSQLLRLLVGGLDWPKGSVGFWPCSVLEQGELIAQPRPFLAGIRRMRAPALVVFGQERFAGLFAATPHMLADLSRALPIFYAPPIMEVLCEGQAEAFLARFKRFYAALSQADSVTGVP